MRLSIIIPAYNEEENIKKSLHSVITALAGSWVDWEIIVWDDGSQDKTTSNALAFENFYCQVKVYGTTYNQGKGNALVRAFSKVNPQSDYVLFMDADLELQSGHLNYFLEEARNDVDIVMSSKFHPHSFVNYPFYRRFLSWGYYQLIRLLFGLPCRDTQTGLKMFKYQILAQIIPKIAVKTYAYDIEILALAHQAGYTIKEIPVVILSHKTVLLYHGKRGRIKLIDILKMAYDTFCIWYRIKKGRYEKKTQKNKP